MNNREALYSHRTPYVTVYPSYSYIQSGTLNSIGIPPLEVNLGQELLVQNLFIKVDTLTTSDEGQPKNQPIGVMQGEIIVNLNADNRRYFYSVLFSPFLKEEVPPIIQLLVQ